MPLSRSNNRDTHGGGSWREPFSAQRPPIWEVEKAVLRLKKPGGRERFILKNFHIKPSVPGESSMNSLQPRKRGVKSTATRAPSGCRSAPVFCGKAQSSANFRWNVVAAMIEEKAEAVV